MHGLCPRSSWERQPWGVLETVFLPLSRLLRVIAFHFASSADYLLLPKDKFCVTTRASFRTPFVAFIHCT